MSHKAAFGHNELLKTQSLADNAIVALPVFATFWEDGIVSFSHLPRWRTCKYIHICIGLISSAGEERNLLA